MTSRSSRRHSPLVAIAAVVVLLGAGIIVSEAALVPVPAPVVTACWVVAAAAMAVVVIGALRDAGREGNGFFVAVGQSFKALGRFVAWFF